jgi:putative cardiolipin synthase
MVRSKFHPTFHALSSYRLKLGIVHNLKPIWLFLIALMFLACASLPTPERKMPSHAYDPSPDSRLAVITSNLIEDAEDGTSGFIKLFRNDDAMRWRLLLAEMAEETLDMQYFIWKGDASGDLLLDQVINAADRGVRVRILVDDIYIIGADRSVAALSQHPNIEVRLFNPMEGRSSSTLLFVLEYQGRIEQLNHRMLIDPPLTHQRHA